MSGTDRAAADQTTTQPATPDLASTTVVMLGAGTMGGTFARAVRAAGVGAQNLSIVNSSPESSRRAAERLDAAAGSIDDVAGADAVVIGVKPYQLEDVLPRVAQNLAPETPVVCIAAGTTLEALARGLDGHEEIIRAMPSTPMAVGEGVTQLMPGPRASERAIALTRALLSVSGLVVDLPEDKGHAVIAAAGSAPAFVFTVIDAMVDEAVRQGIPRPQATEIVVQTVRGAATLLQETGDHPAVARGQVMSPGGTTAEGVAALERHGIRGALAAAMDAAAAKSRAMSQG